MLCNGRWCKNCGEWNTLVEEIVEKKSSHYDILGSGKQKIINITEVETGTEIRLKTVSEELDRVLGGGIVLGFSIRHLQQDKEAR